VPGWLCEGLLRDGWLLIIIDGLSEMTLGPGVSLPLHPDFPVSSLIITSRSESLWSDPTHTDIRPRRIDRDHLLPFMNAYLGRSAQSLTDGDIWDACKRLCERVGNGRSITPLLARLYAEQLANTDALHREVGRNVPHLVLGY